MAKVDRYIVRVHYRTLAMDYADKYLPMVSKVPGHVHYIYLTPGEADIRVNRVLNEGIQVAQNAACGSLVRHIPASRILAVDVIRCVKDWTGDDIPTVEETLRGV